MKKVLIFMLLSVIVFTAQAQKSDESLYYNGIETYNEMHLTSDQIAKIKKLNREVGPKFEEIGRSRSLSGYQKGQQKRALALKHKEEIRKILTADQVSIWEKRHGKWEAGSGIKDSTSDHYDNLLDALEDQYKAAERKIENDPYLSKEEKKVRKKALKEKYKAEKQKEKDKKRVARDAFSLQ